jgi:3-(3-hydroxy-phenyl)propionate hydroxylase
LDQVDVAIVGYGPVGATLANLLAKEGLQVAIIERASSVHHQPRAGHFDGEVMRVFQTIGIADEVSSQAMVNPGMRFVDAQGALLLDWPRPQTIGPDGCYASYRFHQPYLEIALRRQLDRLGNTRVFLEHEVTGFDDNGDRVLLDFHDLRSNQPQQLSARYLVGCDGGKSLIRRLMLSSLDDLGSHEQWLVIDLRLHQARLDLPKSTIQWCDPDRPITMACGVETRRRWEIMLLPGEDPAKVAQPEFYWPILDRWVKPEEADVERAVVYTFHAVIADRWRNGRALLAGDACHQTPPFMGQGMCAGIRDAANLSWKLADVVKQRASEDLLDTYQSERAPHAREFIRIASRLGSLVHVTDPIAAAARDLQLKTNPSVMNTPQPRLGPGIPTDGSPLAGTRAAQPRLNDGRLLDDVVGNDFVVLCVADIAAQLKDLIGNRAISVIDAQHSEVRDYLQNLGAIAILIRPDRYIVGIAQTLTEMRELIERLPLLN